MMMIVKYERCQSIALELKHFLQFLIYSFEDYHHYGTSWAQSEYFRNKSFVQRKIPTQHISHIYTSLRT